MEPMIGNDTFWIEQALNGDLEAFNQLVLKYQDLAYRQALLLCNDSWVAEETVQESFLKAFQNLRGFRGGSFRSWLMRIVTNTTYDVMRQTSRRPTQPLFPDDEDGDEMDSPAWLADPNVSVEGSVEQNEKAKVIHCALNELQDIYRHVITLIDMQDFDYEEAARALNIPVGTVKSRLARARLQLRDKLRDAVSPLGELLPITAN
jgi:RNA polymerase sigma-70 factor (ECF subfamily)